MDAKKPATALHTEEEQKKEEPSLHDKISAMKQSREEHLSENVAKGRQSEVCMV